MKNIDISNALRSLLLTIAFVGATVLTGCSADSIMGPEETSGPTMEASSNPHYPVPPNDDCSVGPC